MFLKQEKSKMNDFERKKKLILKVRKMSIVKKQ